MDDFGDLVRSIIRDTDGKPRPNTLLISPWRADELRAAYRARAPVSDESLTRIREAAENAIGDAIERSIISGRPEVAEVQLVADGQVIARVRVGEVNARTVPP